MTDNEMNKAIGEWLAEKRQKSGLSQQDIADMLGTTRTAVHYWETGKRAIFATHVINYCKAIHADPDELKSFIAEMMR